MQNRLVVGLAIALASSACDKKAEGQTVAVVNGEEITSSELNAELASANIPADADKKEATSRILQSLIDRRLMAQQAKKEGIDRSPEFITRQRRTTEDLLINMLATRQLDTAKLPDDAAIADLERKRPQAFGNREIWRLNQLIYDTPKEPAILARIAQTKNLDQLAAVLTSAGVTFTRANNQVATDVIPTEIFPRLSALPPGEPFIVPNGGRSVASSIVARDPAPITGSAARAAAANVIRRESSAQVLQQRLKELRASAKLEYKEGFAPAK
jgi:EpsD family peptidyl-prolyl cis-trans isomerase